MAEAERLARFWAGIPERGRWVRFAGALGLGLVLSCAQEPSLPARNFLVLVALVLAFRAVQHMPARQAGWFGWGLGVGYFCWSLRWIVEPFFVDPVRHGWMAPFAILGMGGGLALFWAAGFWLAARFGRGTGPRMVLLAALLAGVEYLRAHVLSGFPWAMLSYGLVDTPFDGVMAWVGPHGATLMLTGVAALSAYAFHRGWTLIWPAYVPIFLVWGYVGALSPKPEPINDAPLVRLVQPNAPQNQKWDLEWIPVFFARAIEATRADPPPDVVIWPETSVAALLQYADPWLQEIGEAGRGASVLVGIQRYAPETGYHNSAALIETDGTVAELYDKRHLVPFGEYVPLSWILGDIGLTRLEDMAGGFSPGTGSGTLDIPGLGRARVLICYEGIFPEEVIEDGPRPDVIVIITNDAWFGTGAGPRQHLVQAQARAIEQGIPVLRSANTGVSAVIDGRGRIQDRLDLGETGYLDVRLTRPLPPTGYARYADLPFFVLLFGFVSMALALPRRFGIDGGRGEV